MCSNSFTQLFSLNAAQAKATSSFWKIYQGRFSLIAGAPTVTFPGGHFLNGVAAVSASDVWAVGNYVNSSFQPTKTLIEHWNGKQWSRVKGPKPGSFENSLSSVAVVSANDIWAVGFFSNTSTSSQTLTEHWNGSIWSVVTSPSPGSGNVYLNGVAAVSTDNVWAVGSTNTGSATLFEHWNGTQWSVVTSPNPGQFNVLGSVGVVSGKNIWAVGQSLVAFGQVLIAHWNGSNWSGVTSPNAPGSTNNNLASIAVISASDIWAVGGFQDSSLAAHSLTENWNGSTWSVVPAP